MTGSSEPSPGSAPRPAAGASPTSFDLGGKRVLVVGASSGIGLAIAREFARAGAAVTVVAEVDEVRVAARSIATEIGGEIRAVVCDITDEDAVDRLAAEVDGLDVLINNAGVQGPTPLADRGANERFRRHLDVNVAGLYWVTQRLAPKMGNGGRIVFTASIWAKTAGPEWSAYVASKHAVLGLVRTLAMELGPRGIAVNAVCPGTTATEVNVREMGEEKLAWLREQMVLHPGLIPPESIAAAYLFLASPAASFITGHDLAVDGGFTAQ